MYSSRLHLYLLLLLTILTPALVIGALLIPIYLFLQHYYSDFLTLTITLIIYIIILNVYFTIFPLRKIPTQIKQTKEEK